MMNMNMKKYVFEPKCTDLNGKPLIFTAENKQEAYYMFLQECLGIKLTQFQKEDSLKELVVGNHIFDYVDCDEVLE